VYFRVIHRLKNCYKRSRNNLIPANRVIATPAKAGESNRFSFVAPHKSWIATPAMQARNDGCDGMVGKSFHIAAKTETGLR
jgi:hypothetical protein